MGPGGTLGLPGPWDDLVGPWDDLGTTKGCGTTLGRPGPRGTLGRPVRPGLWDWWDDLVGPDCVGDMMSGGTASV